MKRKIIKIDEEKCNGCGNCVPVCAEGALQIIDGKARLISDLFCDGLGACLGHCPEGAMIIEEREAEPYDEMKVMNYIVAGGPNVIKAHLEHLKDHNELGYLRQAYQYLKEHNIIVDDSKPAHNHHHHHGGGCPGSKARAIAHEVEESGVAVHSSPSQLRQWPIQMHLISPRVSFFRNSNLLLAADCVSFAMGNFHNDYLKGRTLAIACPKLDQNMQVYVDKLVGLIDEAQINSITVMIMEVPCCGGLVKLVQQALQMSQRDVPVNVLVVSLEGKIIQEGVLA